MVCNICGRENQDGCTVCIHCGAIVKNNKTNATYFEYSTSDAGFSKPDSSYIKAEVIKSNIGGKVISEITEVAASHSMKDYMESKFDYYSKRDEIQEDQDESSESLNVKKNENKFISLVQTKEVLTNLWKKLGTKKIVIILSVMATIVIMILSANFIFHKVNDYNSTMDEKEAIEVFYNNENRETLVYNTSGDILHKINDTAKPVWYSQNCSRALLKSEIDDSLYYVNENKQVLFKTNMYSMGMSLDGKLLYSSNKSEGNQLKLIDIESQGEKVIDEDKELKYLNVSISPDGRSYAYTKGTQKNDYTDCETFISINGGEPTSIGKGIVNFMISDNGSYLYNAKIISESKFEFYVKGDGEPVLLSKEIQSIAFNHDYSETIFSDSLGTYISSKGKETIKVSNAKLRDIIVPMKGSKLVFSGGAVYPVTSFKNMVITCHDNTLRYIDGNYQSKLLTSLSNFANITVSPDGNKLMYLSIVGDITKISDLSGEMNKEIIALGVDKFVANKNLSQVYYTKRIYYGKAEAETLLKESPSIALLTFPTYDFYYKKGNNEPIMIASQIKDFQLNATGNIAFFIKVESDANCRLYSSTNGEEATPVEGFETVDSLEKWNYGVVVKEKINDRFNIYYNTSGKEFKLILENVLENVSNPVK